MRGKSTPTNCLRAQNAAVGADAVNDPLGDHILPGIEPAGVKPRSVKGRHRRRFVERVRQQNAAIVPKELSAANKDRFSSEYGKPDERCFAFRTY
jgi:hypothetical protein